MRFLTLRIKADEATTCYDVDNVVKSNPHSEQGKVVNDFMTDKTRG